MKFALIKAFDVTAGEENYEWGWKEKYAKNTMHAIIKKVSLSEQKTRTLLFLNLAYWPGRLSVT